MGGVVRVRLKLDDSVLTDSQKWEGFKRWWVSVEPASHPTVSDLVSHILHSFHLHDSCPHGILLSMDGFVLPLFESIAIFNDNDLLCVKRKGSELLDGVREAVVEQTTNKGSIPFLANQTQTQEEDDVQIGNASFKKRKASKCINSSSKKKRQLKNDESSSAKNQHPDSSLQNGYCQNKSPNCKQDIVHNAVCCSTESEEETVTPFKPDGTVTVSLSRSTKRKKAQRQYKRTLLIAKQEQLLKKQSLGEELDDDDHPKESDQDTGDEIVPVVVRPGHIRFAAPGKEKTVQQYQEAEGSFNWHGIMNNKKGQKWGKQKQTPSKRNENKNQAASKWNECGAPQNKQSAYKWNEHRSPKEKKYVSAWGGNRSTERQSSGSKWNDYRTHNRNWAAQKAPPANASMEYEKLVPMTDFPVQGDTIAYRLLEMSSSFCPQLTSYRVGEVSWSDQESNMVLLVPVPEYPFEFKKATKDTSDELSDASRYKEDGSLKIDFPSLADVRIVKRGGMNPSTLHSMANGTPVSGWNSTSSGSGWGNDNTVGSKVPSSQAKSTGNKWTGKSMWASPLTAASGWGSTSESGWRTETPRRSKDHQSEEQPMNNNWTGMNTAAAAAASASTSENGNKDVWEEISAAFIAKKEERLKEDNWNKQRKPVGNSWSYRTLRSSSRPTMAMSRAQSGRGAN